MWNVLVSPLVIFPNLPGWVINGPVFFCCLEGGRLPEENSAPGKVGEKSPLTSRCRTPVSPPAAPGRRGGPRAECRLFKEQILPVQ